MTALALTLVLLGVFCSAVFSGAETGAYQFNRTRLRLALAEGSRPARMLERMTGDLTTFVVVCLIGTNLANAFVSFASTLAIEHLGYGAPELIATVAVAPFLFVLGELAPKELFRRQPDRFLYVVAPLVSVAAFLFRPLAWVLSGVTALLRLLGLRGEEGGTLGGDERLRQAIAAGAEGGTLTQYQATLARNIFSLRTRAVRHAMVRLENVDMLDVASDLEEARAYARRTGRRRLPVFEQKRARVIGVVDLYELLFEERPGAALREYVDPALVVPPQERVAEALVHLRRARTPLAVVTEASGAAVGVITLKDLVEEITGELADL
ncbi:MAG: CNNM domain-containing protein [Planctomycetota bacterium]